MFIDKDNFEDEDHHDHDGKEAEEDDVDDDNQSEHHSEDESAAEKSTTPANGNGAGGGAGNVEETSTRDIDSSKKHNLPQVSDIQISKNLVQSPATAFSQPDDTSLVEQVLRKDASAVKNHGLNADPFSITSDSSKDSMSPAVDSGASTKSFEPSLVDQGSSVTNKYKGKNFKSFEFFFLTGGNYTVESL